MKRNLLARRHLLFVDDAAGEAGGGTPSTAYTPPATQADLDRIIGERLARVRTAPPADYDDLKAAKAELDRIQAESASEIDRARAEAKREGATEVMDKANERLKSAEARALAAELKFRNPSAAVRLIELGDVSVSEAGDVDAAAIRTRLERLAQDEAYLLDDGKGRPKVDPGQGQGGGTKPSGVNAGRDMFEARRKPAPTS